MEQSGFCDFNVVMNDKTELAFVNTFDKILISPGPGLPEDAGIVPEVIKHFSPTKSILGVCLGHQAIGIAFGAKLKNLDQILHGQATPTKQIDKQEYLFDGIPDVFEAGRYHSWVVDTLGFPDDLKITAADPEGNIMALSHKTYDVKGLQFHPESILTPSGRIIMENWLTTHK